MTCWKNMCLIVSSFIMPYYICCIPGNIFSDYFSQMNCSVSDSIVFKTYNRIECASKCLSDDLCDGFQTVKINTNSALCSIFNISSTSYAHNSDKNTFIKTNLLSQFKLQCSSPVTSDAETTTIQSEQQSTNLHTTTNLQSTISKLPIPTTEQYTTSTTTEPGSTTSTVEPTTTEAKSTTSTVEPTTTEAKSTSTVEPTTAKTTDQIITAEQYTTTTEPESTTSTVAPITSLTTTQTTTEAKSTTSSVEPTTTEAKSTTATVEPTSVTITSTSPTTTESINYSCNVGAALYITSSGEIWLFFNNYIQIYNSISDLTTSNFRREKITDIFSDAPSVIEAGYFDGTNIVLIKDPEAYIYSSWTAGSTVQNKLSTDAHFGYTVPSVIDAVIVNGNNDFFIFSNNDVTRINSGKTTFPFDNNGASNYYKATNNGDRPAVITAGIEADDTTHYLFNGNQVTRFTEGSKKGTFYNTGDVLCS